MASCRVKSCFWSPRGITSVLNELDHAGKVQCGVAAGMCFWNKIDLPLNALSSVSVFSPQVLSECPLCGRHSSRPQGDNGEQNRKVPAFRKFTFQGGGGVETGNK